MAKEWHSSPEFREKLETFHYHYARFPNVSTYNQVHISLIGLLRFQMKKLCKWEIRQSYFVGSAFEDLKIGSLDEFDIMVVVGSKNLRANSSPEAGYYYLTPESHHDAGLWDPEMDDKGHVSSRKVWSEFYSIISKTIQNSCFKQRLGVDLKQRAHGPAIQIDVSDSKSGGGNVFSIDLVPTFEVNGQLFVAKSFPDDTSSWRICTSLPEKARVNGIDRYDGCRRKCVRILKAISEREAKFQTLESFHYKMAMFHEARKRKKAKHWKQEKVGQRLMDILAFIQKCLEKHKMEHYFYSEINLLKNVSEAACLDLAYRIKHLRESKVEFYKLIE